MSIENVIQLNGNDNEAVNLAVKCLQNGEIIAVPTDTVYGLAVDASNSSAIAALYKLKGRDSSKPLAICVKSVKDIDTWGDTTDLPKGLLNDLLPGPVTVLLNRKNMLNPDLNPGVTKVGIRVPDTTLYPILRQVTSVLAYPLALTSANLSNEPNSIKVDEFQVLWPKLAAVFDNGFGKSEENSRSREGSTIIDLSKPGSFKITRSGVAFTQTVMILKKYGLGPLT